MFLYETPRSATRSAHATARGSSGQGRPPLASMLPHCEREQNRRAPAETYRDRGSCPRQAGELQAGEEQDDRERDPDEHLRKPHHPLAPKDHSWNGAEQEPPYYA